MRELKFRWNADRLPDEYDHGLNARADRALICLKGENKKVIW